MKRFFLLLLVLVQCAGLCACAADPGPGVEAPAPEVNRLDDTLWQARPLQVVDDANRVWYEIPVGTFYDSDGDGVGDLTGVEEKLDYLKVLGINGILLENILSDEDLTGIVPAYGNMESLQSLLTSGLRHGIRIITDLPLSSTADVHPWFQDAVRYLQGLPANAEPDVQSCPQVTYYFFDRTGGGNFAPVPGTNWFYRHTGDVHRPLLNSESKAVRAALDEVAAFWLENGVYGFRLPDITALHTDTPERAAEFITAFCNGIKQVYPDSYLAAASGENDALFAGTGLDSIFNTSFAGEDGLICAILQGGSASAYGRQQANLPAIPPVSATLYAGADTGRSSGWYDGDTARIKMGHALHLLMPGSVFLRAGEELGMDGADSAPMHWSENPNGEGMCTGTPGTAPGTPEEQLADENSILRYVQRVLLLLRQNPGLARGEAALLQDFSGKTVCVFTKEYGEQTLLLVLNPTAETQVADLTGLTVQGQSADALETLGVLLTGSEGIMRDEHSLTLPPHSILLLGSP